jgi:hypothetical protein
VRPERPNTVFGLIAKRAELIKLRERLDPGLSAVAGYKFEDPGNSHAAGVSPPIPTIWGKRGSGGVVTRERARGSGGTTE